MHETSLFLALVWALTPVAPAAPSPASYTLDLPYPANLATPVWLGHPQAPAGAFASLSLPLTTPEAGESLLVTVTFQEKEGGFLRVSWQNGQGEQVLSNNFYEGVGMTARRTLLIPAEVVQDGGALVLQASDTTLDVERIHLEWLENRTALVSPERLDEEVIPQTGPALPASALDGQPPRTELSSLDGSLVTVPIAATPQRIEQGVEFGLQFDGIPRAARLSFEESGLPWGRHLVLWINQQRAGIITPAVPDLADAGFSPDTSRPYAGWRNASVYLPPALLRVGLNSLQISVESDTPAGDGGDDSASGPPLAVAHLTGQFDYAPAVPSPPAAAISTNNLTAALPPLPPAPATLQADDPIATPGASAATPVMSLRAPLDSTTP